MITAIASTVDPGALGWLHLRDVAVTAAQPAVAETGTVEAAVAEVRAAALSAERRQLGAIGGDASKATEEDAAPEASVLDRLRGRLAVGLHLDVTA